MPQIHGQDSICLPHIAGPPHRMILDVYDLKTKQCRQLPLGQGRHGAHGVTADKAAMVALPGEGQGECLR